ncbi:MAG: TAXI family TRAP transporter solute-binding subunit [bacterium]|nr:TAXI family TRAP transporter solute-binding subunit [bacterium]
MKRILILFLLLPLWASCDQEMGTRFVNIGTGGLSGVYYPVGQGLARLLNEGSEGHKVKAAAQSTGGSVFNINAVLSGDLQLGIAQSDRQYQAYYGQAEWEAIGPQLDLRSIAALHPEAVTLVASVDSGIQQLSDLKGQRVNLGNPGSGQLGNARDVLAAFGISEADLDAKQVKAVEAPGLLQDERIDAFFYTVGHPNGNLKEATSGRVKVGILAITGPPIQALISAKPYYAPAQIFRKYYPAAAMPEVVDTVGVKATLVTSAKLDAQLAYQITQLLVEHFEEIKAMHPAFEGLKPESLLEGLSAPLHPGALKYYREKGFKVPERLQR